MAWPSDEWVDAFRREGHGVLPAVVDPNELIELRAIFRDLFARRAGRAEGNQFDMAGTDRPDEPQKLPQILYPSRYARTLETMNVRRLAEHVGRAILGEAARLEFDHAILKPARWGAETAWHQDEAYWDPAFVYDAVTVWIPLDDVDEQNGCLHFVPGSHNGEVRGHHTPLDDPRIHAFELDAVDAARGVACPIAAGDVSVHHCRTMHYAGGNASSEPRTAYSIVLGVPPRPRGSARSFEWQTFRRTQAESLHRAAARQSRDPGVDAR
jgi:ectoine hydroxylase-related dioxygenase (phytanoyl-CoA dioxygenase family)